MKLKKIIASLAAVTMAIGMVGSIGASAYTSKGSWSVQYVAGSPSYPTSYSDSVTMYTYGGGYQTYCSSIYGGSDRYVGVSASGMSNFVITSTGYSTKKTISTSGNQVTMYFAAYSSSNGTASGTAGYYG